MQNLGFSTGCFYKSGLTLPERLRLISSYGCKTVELSFLRENELLNLLTLGKKDLKPFDYVSLHAPKYSYQKDKTTEKILATIKKFCLSTKMVDLVVFHPDTVHDFSVFKNLKLPVAFENMDYRSKFGQTTLDILHIMKQTGIRRVVFDVNHAFTTSQGAGLTAMFLQTLNPWIDQIHLSGYAPPDHSHWPLFKTNQAEIVRSIKNWERPIIIESVLEPNELAQERDYILSIINSQQ